MLVEVSSHPLLQDQDISVQDQQDIGYMMLRDEFEQVVCRTRLLFVGQHSLDIFIPSTQEYDASAESEMIHLEMNVDDDDDADSGRSVTNSKYRGRKYNFLNKFPRISWKCRKSFLA